jgi:methyltransferase (TIGR00027 family)
MTRQEEMIGEVESLMNRRQVGSTTAEGVVLMRAREMTQPAEERICSDPYAIRFIRPEIIAYLQSRSPTQRKEDYENYERHFPGHHNSVMTRVRFFDEVISDEVAGGVRQVVILGAGYDTRAYRICGIEKARVFEIDRDETLEIKQSLIKQIFGALSSHVSYIPLDITTGRVFDSLLSAGFDPTIQALFVMEGLLCYLPPPLVRQLFRQISQEMAAGSRVLFDCFPQSMVDGTHPLAVAEHIRHHVESVGEPFLFGIPEDGEEEFLADLGFGNVLLVTDREYLHELFPWDSPERTTTGLMRFYYAEVGAR